MPLKIPPRSRVPPRIPAEPREVNPSRPRVELRDYFIAAALQGLSTKVNLAAVDYNEKLIAKIACRIADETLIERER